MTSDCSSADLFLCRVISVVKAREIFLSLTNICGVIIVSIATVGKVVTGVGFKLFHVCWLSE